MALDCHLCVDHDCSDADLMLLPRLAEAQILTGAVNSSIVL
jgi:hypothetical protein